MSGLKVKCPNCKRIFFSTTDKYDPDVSPNGSMVRLLPKWSHWPLDWICTAGTKAAELSCPECLGQLAHKGGRLLVVDDEEILSGRFKIHPVSESDQDDTLLCTVENLPESEFICDVCGKSCKSQLGLNSHMRSHEVK
jgi:hypothetical protein